MHPTTIQIVSAGLFALAILHTFCTPFFHRLAMARPTHAGLWHLLGEVEVVFGFWAFVLVGFLFAVDGMEGAIAYVDGRNFTEPMFVFAIMVVAGTRAVLQSATLVVRVLMRLLPLPGIMGFYLVVLAAVPLMGSFITEPAAMTLGALMLSERVFAKGASPRLMYATLGVLFVNVSIGGVLTPYAAPPVLMVASKWNWDLSYMASTFGWKAALAVAINAAGATVLFARELARMPAAHEVSGKQVPLILKLTHIALLAGIVLFAHHPALFMGIFLFFMGIATAYPRHQDRLILREGLLVAFFLAGLVVLGGQQQWWLQPLLMSMSSDAVYYGATALTAITDNAALTYLGSLVEGLSDEFKYALVAGAVTGGGLTIIANAPNPAGVAILRKHFPEETVSSAKLLLAALIPTLVAIGAFRFL